LDDIVKTLLACHDIGKLTKRWQDEIRKPSPRPLPHASIGAAFLWRMLESLGKDKSKNIRPASSFAILIHHIDKGIIGHNTERPHVQLILHRLVNDDGTIRWHQDAEKILSNLFQIMGKNQAFLASLRLEDVEEMAEDLRVWSRGVGVLERHRHRIMASSLHHVLKMCDLRASVNREDLKDAAVSPLVTKFVEGGFL
jgi:CRISPR-associated endonuclease Cas3-HD